MSKNPTSKQQAMAREIGQLKAALANRDQSIAHYRELVKKHTQALHRKRKEIAELRRAAHEPETLHADISQEEAWRHVRGASQPPSAATPRDIVEKLVALVEGRCPACGGNDLHSASIDGKAVVSCCECPWGISYEQLRADALTPTKGAAP